MRQDGKTSLYRIVMRQVTVDCSAAAATNSRPLIPSTDAHTDATSTHEFVMFPVFGS